MYKHTRMDDQNDSDSLPSWLKDDKNVMGGTADTRPLVTTTLSKTSSYGGGGGGGSSSSDHAAHVEEDYGEHDASFVAMDSMPMGGEIGGGGGGGLFQDEGEVDISWAVDPESQSQQTRRSSNRGDSTSRTRNSREDENKVASRKNYGSVMEVDQKRQRHWQDYPEDDESQEEDDEDEDEDEDDSGSSGGSESDDNSSDSSDSHDGSDEEETKLISSTSTKNWTREKSTRYQKQSSSSQKGKKWYNGGSSFNNNGNQKKKKKKRKKVMRKDDKKRGKRTPPRRNCCHSFFIVVQIAAILANLCMIAIEVVPMVFVLRAHKPETVQILDVALRCYFTFFSTSFLVTELEWIDSSLNNWITRGFLYTFLGVVAREQHLAMLANGTLVVKENSKDYWNGVWASLFVEISSWWIIGIGVLYFLLGLFCMKVVRNRFREQYQARLRDFYDNEEEYEDS